MDQSAGNDDDEIRTYVLNKKLTLWERILRWVYSKEEWDAYMLEKIEKYRAKGMKFIYIIIIIYTNFRF